MSNTENNQKEFSYGVLVFPAIIIGLIAAYFMGYQEMVTDFLKATALLILALSILVVIHEFGHFITAKMFGMRVERFYLFFDFLFPMPNVMNFAIWKKQIGDTEYGLGWFPMGGYVNITGIIDEAMDESQVSGPPEPWEFRAKPIWQRIVVMLGGIIMNVLLGITIFSCMKFMYGENRTPMASFNSKIEVIDTLTVANKKGVKVRKTSIGHVLGFRTGDKIISFMGKQFPYYEDYSDPKLMLESNAYYQIERDNKPMEIKIPSNAMNFMTNDTIVPDLFGVSVSELPAKVVVAEGSPAEKAGVKTGDNILKIDSTSVQLYTQLKEVLSKCNPKQVVKLQIAGKAEPISVTLDSNKRLGVLPFVKQDTIHYGVLGSIGKGTAQAFGVVSTNARGLGKMAKGEVDASKSVMGPLGIAKQYLSIFSKGGWKGFMFLTGMLSMVLAFMNILPIPALDGGHVVVLLVEGVLGRELSIATKMRIQQVGMVILLGLMVMIFGNDIFSHLFR